MKHILTFLSLLVSAFSFAQTDNFLPKSTTGQILKHTFYTLSYSEPHEQAEWVAYVLTPGMINGSTARTDDFRPDSGVTSGSASLADYKGSGFDRGHLAPAADFKIGYTAMSESFYMSNMSPQNPSFNRGIWKKLEEQVRSWAIEENGVYVVTAGILTATHGSIGPNRVSIPTHFYKIVYDYSGDEKMIGFILPNAKGTHELTYYAVTINEIEARTGIDFFYNLPDDQEEQLESTLDKDLWDWTIKYSSSPSEGTAAPCMGTAKSTGARCKNKTNNDNGYCYAHQEQVQGAEPIQKTSTSRRCSAIAKSTGNRCKRMTTNANGRCWQHQ